MIRRCFSVSTKTADSLFTAHQKSATALFREQRMNDRKARLGNSFVKNIASTMKMNDITNELNSNNNMNEEIDDEEIINQRPVVINKKTGKAVYTMQTKKSSADLFREHRMAVRNGATTASIEDLLIEQNENYKNEENTSSSSSSSAYSTSTNEGGASSALFMLLAAGVSVEALVFYVRESKEGGKLMQFQKFTDLYQHVWKARYNKLLEAFGM